ncbi:MAG: DSD1 family PLP-dependent enzyme [Pseudomonadota bacterium]|nr:DSD1 family PLP-dependent enzyme [Pseudomonadota bacterium]
MTIQPPPARIGDPVNKVDTPALIVDLDILAANIARMQRLADSHGVRLRPHAKTHKSADIGRLQVAAGAVGLCCQKVSEAEAMVAGGIGDVLVSNQVVGRAKIDRLVLLARRARVGVCVDDPVNLAEIAAAARHAGVSIDALVEIDVGMARCGVPVGETALALCRDAVEAEGLRFAGLQAYHGSAQHIRGAGERGTAIARGGAHVRRMLDLLAGAGIDCPTVTGAGTGTAPFEAASGLWTELQAGSYVFMDADYARNHLVDGDAPFGHSLFVLAGVMSVARAGQAVCDAGLKSMSFESGLPLVHGRRGVTYARPSDEHGSLALEAGVTLELGDRVRLIPGHCDPTVNLHDWYVGIRDGHVAALWPVSARGAVF